MLSFLQLSFISEQTFIRRMPIIFEKLPKRRKIIKDVPFIVHLIGYNRLTSREHPTEKEKILWNTNLQ